METNATLFDFEQRSSESSYVDAIWRTHTHSEGTFMSVAEAHWGLVITNYQGKVTAHVRGPETKATPSPVPEDAEIFGIVFKLGTFMAHLPAMTLVDNPVVLPDASSDNTFWLNGSAWEMPEFENADTFINRLVRQGLIAHEPVVDAALQGQITDLSSRSVQRRFLRATGLTHGTVYQIERARHAMTLLSGGSSILDTVDLAGYADQSHLTRALKHFIGQTPSQIISIINRE